MNEVNNLLLLVFMYMFCCRLKKQRNIHLNNDGSRDQVHRYGRGIDRTSTPFSSTACEYDAIADDEQQINIYVSIIQCGHQVFMKYG